MRVLSRSLPSCFLLLGLLGALAVSVPSALLGLVGRLDRAETVVLVVGSGALTLVLLARLALLEHHVRGRLSEQIRLAAWTASVSDADALLLAAVDRVDLRRRALRAALGLVADGSGRCVVGLAEGSPHLAEMVAVDGRGVETELVAQVDLRVLLSAAAPALSRRETWSRQVDLPGLEGDTVVLLPLVGGDVHVGALVVSAPTAAVEQALPALRRMADQLAAALDAVRLREAATRTGQSDGAANARAAVVTPGLVAELNAALRTGALRAHYQPVVHLGTGATVGFEALVRWEHPDRGVLGPGAFLEQVEQVGLLSRLDAMLLEQACIDAVSWDPGPKGPYVAVNLSTGMLRHPATPALVRHALARSGLWPWRLVVEVTETSTLQDPEAVADVLRRIRAIGVAVALDDFGTGYSSLSWLQALPLDIVKVDRSFVERLPLRDGERPVVAALVGLAQTLGLDVVAEGVEREEQRAALHALGVDKGQGWLWSPAVPADVARARVAPLPRPRRATHEDVGAPSQHPRWPSHL